ncbi:hypothetical protein ATN84_25685 [Paramesorhizobium deserti]|uniref:DUF2247 domain-containing protein n=1 Tax=Paramesorhizobium deserti TaxID=1494590 RepID=A0A135HTH2_9HYPH|nr:DUF2247 family protein [Paramesorhizobium deserti]KXF76501.1 hypothetical protein ATN84_25685 [Paramesorhizobium deserti]
MEFALPGKFCAIEMPSLDWHDLKYGLSHKYISEDGVIEFALETLTENSNEIHYDLATCSNHFDVPRIMEQLAFHENKNPQLSKQKWLYLILLWVFLHKESYPDPFSVVEEIYADFDYPEEVAPFVRYMPVADGEAVGEKALMEKWAAMLTSFKKKLA